MLDPHISYEGLKINYINDPTLLIHLKDLKTGLLAYFDKNYPLHSPTLLSLPSMPIQALSVDGLPQKSFTAQYC